jgi:hypothetical protein
MCEMGFIAVILGYGIYGKNRWQLTVSMVCMSTPSRHTLGFTLAALCISQNQC